MSAVIGILAEKFPDLKIIRITLTEWEDKFQLLFEGEKETDERPCFVTGEEVRQLLENCRRVPEQMLPKH